MIKPIKHIESVDTDGKEGVHYEIIDKDDNDIPDGVERKNEGEEISDYEHPEASTSKSILESGRKLIAGENLAGKIGGKVKDVLKRFVPLGEKIDSVTDAVGDSLKTEQTQKPMLQKILSVKNFINLKDENGDFDWSELGASLLQLVLAGAIVWGAQELGILDAFLQLLEQSE